MKYDTDALKRAVTLEELIVAGPSGTMFHAHLLRPDGQRTRRRRIVVKLPPMRPLACPLSLGEALSAIAPSGVRLRVEERNALEVLAGRDTRKRWQAQPGYTHMHPAVHFDASIPMLISLGADGTIAELRERLDEQTSPGAIWLRIAWQLSEAMAFLFERVQLAHVDIQPKHVLFVRYGDRQRRLHCWLSDYGDLCPVDGTADVFERGDDAYKPHGLTQEEGVSHREHSLFAYYATLLDLFLFRMYAEDRETYITDTGHSVSGFLRACPDSDLMDRLQHNPQHPIDQMVLRPLREPLTDCHAHFYETMRPWLERTLRAGQSPIY